ncbi:MAG: hypothetical protein C0631_09465 [Sedimenticola sp.]|nr:MAG: hypothetical protein C0631_09465 [Sedimenticola sp.]
MIGPSSRQHCMISWGILILLIVFMVLLVLFPWYKQLASYDESIESREQSIQRFQEKLRQRPALEAALSDPGYESKVRTFYLREGTDALAGAELQQRIKTAIEKTNGNLVSTQLLTSAGQQASVPKVTVKLRMRGDTSDLLNVVHELESSKPLLFVEDLSARGSKSNAGNRQEILDINLTLSGFMYKRQAEQ